MSHAWCLWSRKSRKTPTLAALASLFLGVGLGGCGKASQTTTPAGGSSGPATVRATSTIAARSDVSDHRRPLGDYDEDDLNTEPGGSDGDNDDRHGPKDADGDSDSSGPGYYDADDSGVRSFGHDAGNPARRAAETLVKRYLAIAYAGEGSKACTLIYSPLARSFPQELGRQGPAFLRGAKTCAAIMSKLFEQNHRQLAGYVGRLHVVGVRVKGHLGLVLLLIDGLPGRQVELILEHGAWKMFAPLDNELP